jgi:hypothetical protein
MTLLGPGSSGAKHSKIITLLESTDPTVFAISL